MTDQRDDGKALEDTRDLRPADGHEGGEAACFLARVCPECDAVADTDPPTRCARCGATMPG